MKRFLFFFLLLGGLFFVSNAHALEKSKPVIITGDKLKTILDTARYPYLLIDARTAEEYKEAHIRGAINIPVNEFEEDKYLLPKDKTVRLIFYCNGVK